jgi:transcriptional regulator with XRE-family HTH domain
MTDVVIPTWRLQDRLKRSLDEVPDLSIPGMAAELGVTRQTVTNYLHGHTVPNRSTLRVWAMRCGVPFDWLANGIEGVERGEEADTSPVTLR